MLNRRGIECELAQHPAERRQVVSRACRAQMLVHGGGIVIDPVDEEEPALLDEVAQPFRPRLEQLDHGEEPATPAVNQIVVPQAGGFEALASVA